MTCPALHTGSAFLSTVLAHLDCQGQAIGAYGYGALADPGSSTAIALTGLLTIFIALFGLRLMLGQAIAGRDVVGEVIKVGLVLTLATAWPAWRVVGYDLVLNGPSEIAHDIGLASGLPGGDGSLITRLQNADDALVAITMYGSGRLTGGVLNGSDLGDSFHGIALGDETGLGWGRVAFLVGEIGPYAVTRLGAGLLLALAPLMAGLALFTGTASLFRGWLKGLAFVALGALALAIVNGVELALIGPWAAEVLAQRGSNAFTPSAPTEMLVLTSAFAMLNLGILTLIARVCFLPHLAWPRRWAQSTMQDWGTRTAGTSTQPAYAGMGIEQSQSHSRAQAIVDAVAVTLRREESGGSWAPRQLPTGINSNRAEMQSLSARRDDATPEPLGSSYRRNSRRNSAATANRDAKP